MIKKILVPIDGSEHAQKAVEFASNVAMQNEATIHLLHIISSTKIPKDVIDFVKSERIEEPPTTAYLQIVGNQILGKAESEAKERGLKKVEKNVMKGDPAEVIIDYAKEGDFDMIVIGSRGLGGVKGLMLGSVSSKVCHATDRTCVTVK
jgi:nucleotide-binding universal stress UspA family protein